MQALVFNSETLETAAFQAGMTTPDLLTILTLHEFVHLAMMSWWFKEVPWHGWVGDYAQRFRYVHETVALFFCEFGSTQIYGQTDIASINLYLNYVQQQSHEGVGELFYGPYYTRFRQLESDILWPALEAELGPVFIEDIIAVTALV